VGVGRMLPPGLTREEQLAKFAAGEEYAAGGAVSLQDFLELGRASPQDLLARLQKEAPGALGEVQPGSQFLGAGQSALAFKTPVGDVLRVGFEEPDRLVRPVSSGLNQPTRTAAYATTDPGAAVVTADRFPMASNVGDQSWSKSLYTQAVDNIGPDMAQELFWKSSPERQREIVRTPIANLADRLKQEGLDFWDKHSGNVGNVGKRPVVIDPGAVNLTPAFKGELNPIAQARDPSMLVKLLLDSLGGQRAMQIALAEGRAAPRYQQPLGLAGLIAGGALGSTTTSPGGYR
jgi:hypothetical protein